MVTFALPGDGDDHVADAPNGTPKPRAPLPFAKRTFAASSFGGSPSRRYGTPQTAPARKPSSLREEVPSSSLNSNSIATARNIFRQSTFCDSPPTGAFSPSMPHSAMKRVFAPGATPEPTRIQRQSTAQATPRGMAARVGDKELFPMRISSPPSELTGEVLTEKIPKEWNSKGSIYADQFLAHLCPPDLDEEQRRQFFCILDLRRLKYAANEIFSKKDWKLNVINFAKEFEKSRSIILLRYGLYEFQNVKPSKEVLKRWRREHGLPEPEGEDAESTPSKTAAKKRKADDELSKDSAATSGSVLKGKRRAMDRDAEQEHQEPAVATPAPIKNKRKASVGEDHQPKMLKATPSSAKTLFEKIARKPAAVPQGFDDVANAKASLGAAKKHGSSSLARSVFINLKSSGAQGAPAGNNIFGYLSDASSAKNSGVDADAESESETGSEGDESPEVGQTDKPSVAANGAGDTGSQTGPGSFGKKPAGPIGGFGPGVSSNPDTRESTPGRSLFDRITKGSDGQPVRAEKADAPIPEKPAAPVDQTWNPSTTPIKFAPSASAAQKSGLFGGPTSTPAGPVFAPKSTATPNMFGAAKHDVVPPAKESSAGASADEGAKDGCESDKENESQPPKKSVIEPKTPAAQPAFGPLSASVETPKGTEAPRPSAPLFGSTKTDSKPEASATTSTFGSLNKTNDAGPVTQPPSLFGVKPAEAKKPAEPEAPKAPSLFGGLGTSATFGNTAATGSLFGGKPVTNAGSGFASGTSRPSASLFGGPSALGSGPTAANTDAAPATTQAPPQPAFSFGSASNGDSKPIAEAAPPKPLFGSTQPPSAGTAVGGMFGGSPMRQDEPSSAKKACTGDSKAGSATPIFSFGNSQAATSAPSTSAFGGPSAPASNKPGNAAVSFGAGSASDSGSGGFNFNFKGAGSSGTAFNNPFAKSGSGTSTGVTFNFGATSSGLASGSSTPFQFGGASGSTSAPAFGGASTPGGAPIFNFTSAPSQPPQGPGSVFGSNQAAPAFGSLQPPAGGSSTTGTNSPLNLGGGSSLATTPAVGTPESSNQADGANGGDNDEGEKHEQISLTDGVDANEEVLHEVRAKALKYVPPGDKSDSDDKEKSKSPWSTRGVGPLRLLKHKETGVVRLLLRAEPRGHVVLNRAVLPTATYKADEKYVKVATSNEEGDGLETWMIQVKTKDSAKALADALKKNKGSNKE